MPVVPWECKNWAGRIHGHSESMGSVLVDKDRVSGDGPVLFCYVTCHFNQTYI